MTCPVLIQRVVLTILSLVASQTPVEDNKDFSLLRFKAGPPYEVTTYVASYPCMHSRVYILISTNLQYFLIHRMLSVINPSVLKTNSQVIKFVF